jgi:hypothetical protein
VAVRAAFDHARALDAGGAVFLRGIGACAVVKSRQDAPKKLVPLFLRPDEPLPRRRLNEGLAACDAAAVLSALAAGRSSTSATPTAESTVALKAGAAILAANDVLNETLEEAHYADVASVSAVKGVGTFYFPAPKDLAARLEATTTSEAVRLRLRRDYGLEIPFSASWIQQQGENRKPATDGAGAGAPPQ